MIPQDVIDRVTGRAQSLERIGATQDASDLRVLLAAAPKAEPVRINRQEIAETITGFPADYYACETAGPSLKGDWNEALRLADKILARLDQPEAPKVEQEPLAVWYGSMPESNGRENWTAILHRKDATGSSIHDDGFCFARSEYPDRVRYEADEMRWIIGELAEKPDILTYDDKKHSGYTHPAPASDELLSFPYQRTFNAIADAVKLQAGGISISVEAFERSFNAQHKGPQS
jgi:hypothetical protein